MENLTSFIAGRWVSPSSETLSITHKYSGQEIAKVAMATDDQVNDTEKAALKGYKVLKNWSAEKRSKALLKLSELLEEHKDTLAKLICAEAGKSLGYAHGELERCKTTLTLAASEALKIGGEVVPMDYAAGVGKIAQTKRFPIGPVFGIVPFNFPLNLAMHKLAPSLAAFLISADWSTMTAAFPPSSN